MHLFLLDLLNDSQTINFSKHLLYVTLICGDWYYLNLILPDKAA